MDRSWKSIGQHVYEPCYKSLYLKYSFAVYVLYFIFSEFFFMLHTFQRHMFHVLISQIS